MPFYTLTMKHQKKIKKIIPFIIASKQIKYSGTNLTKEMKNLYTENQKLLPNEIKEDTNKGKYVPCSWIQRLNVKMSILPKVIRRVSIIPIKIPITFFAELGKSILKFIWNLRGLQIVITISKKEEES